MTHAVDTAANMPPADPKLEAPAAERPVKLRLTNVSKTYANAAKPVAALQPINAEIRAGEFVVFFGPSGCGKSTLLNLIAGFEDPTEGEITLDGARVEGPHHDRLMLFQEHGLFPWLNVIENVLFGLRRQFRFKPRARREKARQFLQMVHLDQFEKAPIHELSGGMKQRVALARALAPDPKVLLVDEPFPALDALTRTKLYGDLQEIFLRTSKTIILVTHDAREAACLGDRVLVFSGRPGRIKADIAIDLPRSREINDPKVAEYASLIMNQLEGPAYEGPEI
ncbi:MAG: ABC transporter ATP-binding protein [Verrucomicrobia bacterium]|nr:ABC transporter ATP-binding protein [Verrucomicrobiota bacterium]